MIDDDINPVRSWRLISDGDLWEHFYEAVIKKGTRAVKLTWVHRHATETHIDNNITTLKNRIGNDEADNYAA